MISVCIATHNGEKYIKEELESILPQLREDDEVIISDDGSTDKTLEVISSICDHRIKMYHFRQTDSNKVTHHYVCKNFENAILLANGDYIFLADQDDWWMPNKVEKCLHSLKNNLLVVHQAEICDRLLKYSGKLMYKEDFVFNNYLALKRGKYYGCTLAFKKQLLSQILPFPRNLILHDHWIGCMAELSGSVFYEKDSLIKYRVHGDNTSGGSSPHSLWFQIKYRIYMFYHLNIRRFKKIKPQ